MQFFLHPGFTCDDKQHSSTFRVGPAGILHGGRPSGVLRSTRTNPRLRVSCGVQCLLQGSRPLLLGLGRPRFSESWRPSELKRGLFFIVCQRKISLSSVSNVHISIFLSLFARFFLPFFVFLIQIYIRLGHSQGSRCLPQEGGC